MYYYFIDTKYIIYIPINFLFLIKNVIKFSKY